MSTITIGARLRLVKLERARGPHPWHISDMGLAILALDGSLGIGKKNSGSTHFLVGSCIWMARGLA